MVTHDRRLAEFADRIIHILDGQVQEIEVKEEKEEPYVKEENNSILNSADDGNHHM